MATRSLSPGLCPPAGRWFRSYPPIVSPVHSSIDDYSEQYSEAVLGAATCVEEADSTENPRNFACTLIIDGQELGFSTTVTVDGDVNSFARTQIGSVVVLAPLEESVGGDLSELIGLPADVSCGDTSVLVVPSGETFSCMALAAGREVPVEVTPADTGVDLHYPVIGELLIIGRLVSAFGVTPGAVSCVEAEDAQPDSSFTRTAERVIYEFEVQGHKVQAVSIS